MRAAVVLFVLNGMLLIATPAFAYRDYFTAEQKAQLEKIQAVRIEALALTDKGSVDASPFADLVARRMRSRSGAAAA